MVETAIETHPNPWAWWQTALKYPDAKHPIHESDPQQGYYRVRKRGGNWEPVAIWQDDGEWHALRNGDQVSRDNINTLWVWACREPISHEAYTKAVAGDGWDDEPEAAPTIGHNSAEADPFDALRIELDGEAEMATEFLSGEVQTQADADKAAIWAKRLTAIKNKAEDHRKVEKQPYLDAGRDVDAKWKTVTDKADDLARSLKRHVEPFLIAQKRAEEERARKAREEAERQRAEAMKAQDEEAKAAALKAAEEADRAAQAKNAQAGRTGAKVSIRVEKIGHVTDYAKAAQALIAMKHKEIMATIDQLANRAAKAGVPFDGMEIQEIEKVV